MWLSIINQPFPINTWRWYWLRGIGFGLFVFLFLYFFKPFSLNLYPAAQLLYTTAIYGLITGLVVLTGSVLLIKVIAPRINEAKWTLGRQIIWNTFLMVCIALLNMLVTQWMHDVWLPVSWYFIMLRWVVMLGVFPIVIAELLTYNHFLRRHIKSAAQLTQMVQHTQQRNAVVYRSVPAPQPELHNASAGHTQTTGKTARQEQTFALPRPLLLLAGENQGDKLELPADSLLAVQALDNYVTVYWEKNERLNTTLLRNTLTNIALQIADVPHVFRSHRGWLVNTKKVMQVEGNAQGLRLTIGGMQQSVPVSRANIAGYRALTEQQHVTSSN
ncbi:MAG: LytTR family DNA-binding domain-containing protein [Agriterribacter sp.]